eukprot:Plantae.Rhodophyta-Rhodochaete_pulchella.ctg1345.p1 GENE.Plantae.Rhodophyta-Rhodochaete_pulchella.ctg1345~~Plantae.Rhodophyta-Rhodochaete_pulchella.ctg1345.p1  ORF type:complete len:205 (+),score=14.91 Plantae.Rhodophyta-Rhodochaete_pulchella.ctg1345:61-615(+)
MQVYANPLGGHDGFPRPRGGSLFDFRARRKKAHAVRKVPSAAQDEVRFSNGDVYRGMLAAGVPHGYGVLRQRDGMTFKGEFKDGGKDGLGIATFANGDKYVGDFRGNCMSGYGVYYFCGGGRYTGEFKVGAFHGPGNRVFPSGEFFHGEFENGQPVEGTWITQEGKISFQRERSRTARRKTETK